MLFFRPKCPVSKVQKDWVEEKLLWMVKEFGVEVLMNVELVLPNEDYFPVELPKTEEELKVLFAQICRYMLISKHRVELFCYGEQRPSEYQLINTGPKRGAAGLFINTKEAGRYAIGVDFETMKDPTNLIATMAHELAHVHLIGGNRVDESEGEHEFLTDLLTVFMGLGIFNANSAFQFSQWQSGSGGGWRVKHVGYMSQKMFAYALACFAWMRGELKPSWDRYLRTNIKHYFNQSLKYIKKTKDIKLINYNDLKVDLDLPFQLN